MAMHETPVDSVSKRPLGHVDLPSPPRPITAKAARRSWHEMPVRIWMLLAILVGTIALITTVQRIREANQDRWLIEKGTRVNARIVAANGADVPKRWPRNEPIPVRLRITFAGGASHEISATLDAKPDSYAQPGTDIPIKIDPNDPDRWTEADEARPWSAQLITPAMLIGLTFLLLIVTLFRRSRVLRVWRNAPAHEAIAVSTHHSGLAPRSRVVRFRFDDGAESRIGTVLLPGNFAAPVAGQALQVICPVRRPGSAILAPLYAD